MVLNSLCCQESRRLFRGLVTCSGILGALRCSEILVGTWGSTLLSEPGLCSVSMLWHLSASHAAALRASVQQLVYFYNSVDGGLLVYNNAYYAYHSFIICFESFQLIVFICRF